MKFEEIRWGIIGCGNVAEIKSAPALYKTANSRVLAVMRRNSSKAEDFAFRHQIPHWYTDAGEMLQKSEINAVYIATPPSTHCQYAIMAAQAGKAVYIEKPMALNYGECLRILEAGQLYNVPVFVAYYRRALPYFLKIRELIDNGTLGEIRKVVINLSKSPSPEDKNIDDLPWRVKPEIAGGGYFVDLGSHQLDILRYIFGDIQLKSAIVKNLGWLYNAEDYISAEFTLAGGIPCTGTWNFMSSPQNEIDSLLITGTKGQINASTFGNKTIEIRTGNSIDKIHFEPPQHIQQPLVQTIIEELTTGIKCCPSTGTTASATNLLMDEVLKNYYNR
jgi:predicted dehydrogenase